MDPQLAMETSDFYQTSSQPANVPYLDHKWGTCLIDGKCDSHPASHRISRLLGVFP